MIERLFQEWSKRIEEETQLNQKELPIKGTKKLSQALHLEGHIWTVNNIIFTIF